MKPSLNCKKTGVMFLNDWLNPEPPIVLMQYTGLKDKNGKEIYEGDVVQLVDDMRWQVVYDAPCFWLGDKEGKVDDSMRDSPIYKIIGNIYENPELLNNNK